jgi:hypothetical protein
VGLRRPADFLATLRLPHTARCLAAAGSRLRAASLRGDRGPSLAKEGVGVSRNDFTEAGKGLVVLIQPTPACDGGARPSDIREWVPSGAPNGPGRPSGLREGGGCAGAGPVRDNRDSL